MEKTMKNENIAKVLKAYRKHNKLSVNEVAARLEQRSVPVAPKTIYGWESGQTQPDADTLLLLCDIYQINDILNAFGYLKDDAEPLMLTAFEKQLILKYRNSPDMQHAINKLLDM